MLLYYFKLAIVITFSTFFYTSILISNPNDKKRTHDNIYSSKKENISKNSRKKITDEIVIPIDLYMYLGVGATQISIEQLYSENPLSLQNALLTDILPIGPEFYFSTMFAVSLFGIKIDYSHHAYRPASSVQLEQKVHYFIQDNSFTLNTIDINRGNVNLLKISAGLNLGRKHKKSTYHFIYAEYKYLQNTYYGTLFENLTLHTDATASIIGNGFSVGYEMLADIQLPNINFFSLLISFGFSFGYFSSYSLNVRYGSIRHRNVFTDSNLDVDFRQELARAGNFSVSGKIGIGFKIYGIQILLEYKSNFNLSNVIAHRSVRTLFILKSGQPHSVIFLLGYKI